MFQHQKNLINSHGGCPAACTMSHRMEPVNVTDVTAMADRVIGFLLRQEVMSISRGDINRDNTGEDPDVVLPVIQLIEAM